MSIRFDFSTWDYRSTVPATGNYTVTCWGKVVLDRDAWSTIWASDPGDGTNYHILQTTGDGTTMQFACNGGANPIGPAMVVGDWYRFGVTVNGTTATLYHGAATGTLSSSSGTASSSAAFTTFRVGASAFSGEYLEGSVAALKHWSAVLTPTEIAAELAQFAPARSTNLVRYHPFHVAETTDYSGNGNTLTLPDVPGPSTDASDPPIFETAPVAPKPIFRLACRGRAANF